MRNFFPGDDIPKNEEQEHVQVCGYRILGRDVWMACFGRGVWMACFGRGVWMVCFGKVCVDGVCGWYVLGGMCGWRVFVWMMYYGERVYESCILGEGHVDVVFWGGVWVCF